MHIGKEALADGGVAAGEDAQLLGCGLAFRGEVIAGALALALAGGGAADQAGFAAVQDVAGAVLDGAPDLGVAREKLAEGLTRLQPGVTQGDNAEEGASQIRGTGKALCLSESKATRGRSAQTCARRLAMRAAPGRDQCMPERFMRLPITFLFMPST